MNKNSAKAENLRKAIVRVRRHSKTNGGNNILMEIIQTQCEKRSASTGNKFHHRTANYTEHCLWSNILGKVNLMLTSTTEKRMAEKQRAILDGVDTPLIPRWNFQASGAIWLIRPSVDCVKNNTVEAFLDII